MSNNVSFALTDDAYFEQHFRRIATELTELVLAKRRDYGSSVGILGGKGIIPRIFDKTYRLKSLLWDGNRPNFESAEDTARDLAVYALMLALDLEFERLSVQTKSTAAQPVRRQDVGC